MNHTFIPSLVDNKLCAKCKYDEISHTKWATCEACSNFDVCDILGSMLLCQSCLKKEYDIAVKQSEIRQIETTPLNEAIEIDNKVITSSDLFIAKTVPFEEIERMIELDNSIENKRFKLAEVIKARYKQFQSAIQSTTAKQLELSLAQRSEQIRLNELAGKLTAEERAALKIENIEYNPASPPVKVAKTKLSKEDKMIEMVANTMKLSIEDARKWVRGSLKDAGVTCTCAETPGMCKVHNN